MTAVRLLDPWAVQRSDDGSVGISASDARNTLGALLAQSGPGRTYAGVIPQGTDSATGTPAGLIVSPSTPASNKLQVSPGTFVVQSDAAATAYIGSSDKLVTLTVPPADATNSRTDLAVCWVEDSDAGEGTGKGSFMDVFPGPADGTNALPSNLPAAHTVLATWQTPAGTSTAISSVSDQRTFAVAAGGMRPVINGIGADDPGYPGQPRTTMDTTTGDFSLDLFSPKSASWMPIASKVSSWTPQWSSDKGAFKFGPGGETHGYYMQFVGGLVYIFGAITIGGGSGADAGYGNIVCSLPPGISSRLTQVYTECRFFQYGYAAWIGAAYINQNAIYFAFPNSSGDCRVSFLRSADGSKAAGTGIPNFPGQYSFPAGSDLEFSGLFLAQQ